MRRKKFNPRNARELREIRDELLDEAEEKSDLMEQLISAGKADSQDYKAAENRWKEIMDKESGELIQLEAEGEPLEKLEQSQMAIARERRKQRERNGFDPTLSHGGQPTNHLPSTPRFRDTATGEEIRALAPQESFSRPQLLPSGEQAPRIGAVLADMLTGRNEFCTPMQIQNAIGSNDSGGGYLLNPTMSGQVIDLARSASVALRAGAVTLPLTSAEHTIARLTGDPTAHWRAEQVAVQSSDVTFDRVTLRPKTLAAIVPVSIEMLEDASNIATVIENALQAALGLKLDQAVLFGSGAASEPLGIVNHSTVNTIDSVGTPTDYSDISSAVGDIFTANYPGEADGLAWIHHPREAETYDGLVSTGAGADGQPLQPTPWAAALRKLMTTSLSITEGDGSDESSMIVGAFGECLIGMRTSGVVIRVANDGVVNDGTNDINATSQLMRHIVAYLRADVALLRPNWFTVLSGVTTG